jgi:ABC-type branched-subunit amino acid transport system substrate-binding protein
MRRIIALLLLVTACDADRSSSSQADAAVPQPPLRIAVMMAAREGRRLPNVDWALANVNAAGGVAGRELAVDYFDPTGQDVKALAERVAADDTYVAAVAPPGSPALQQVADVFIEHEKPIVSPTSASDDLLRAYGGKGYVWRTRESDVAQTELLVRFAKDAGAARITLLTSLDSTGATFFTWFGFFARELGYPQSDVTILTYDAMAPCEDTVRAAYDSRPDMLLVAANAPEFVRCLTRAPAPPHGRPRLVLADTGLDTNAYAQLGPGAAGLEGFDGAGSEAYEAAFREKFGEALLAPHGASEYDAILLLAYGLELSGGRGGPSLVSALKKAADGADDGSPGWDGPGIATTLAALRAGAHPRLQGATGPLEFEPGLYMDLAASTLVHWKIEGGTPRHDTRYWTGDPSFLTSHGALVSGSGALSDDVDSSTWTPPAARTDTWALVAALSSGWDNYRHQADALQQYRLLRDAGVPDDHVVLVMADDLAGDPQNRAPGEVRNAPGGADLRAGAEVDYGLTLSSADLLAILRGEAGERTPRVLAPTAGSDVYVYLVGHGGEPGIPVNAQTTADGLAGKGDVLSPDALRTALCALRGHARRVFVVVESCYAGVFGEAEDGGVEKGCDDGAPLEGVVLMTAADGHEVSYAGDYDPALRQWVDDAFSRHFADAALARPAVDLADLYADVYRATAGSHVRFYNTAAAGRMSTVPLTEFFAP